MKVVLDTNVLLVSLLPKFRYYSIVEALNEGSFELCISNEILLEYSEQLTARYNDSFFDILISAFINLPNVSVYDPTYKWKLIESDPDDDKFVDCAIAANADFIVTNDKHFNVLKQVNFPSVNVVNADEFIAILKNI